MNLIPKICEILGVEVGEEFKVARYANVVFRFNETSLQFYASLTNEWRETSDELYKMIMKGDTEVIKLPFKPKEGERYWYVYWNHPLEYPCVTDIAFEDSDMCYHHIYCGNCFRTEAEAKAHKHEIYEKLTGKKWEEKCDS